MKDAIDKEVLAWCCKSYRWGSTLELGDDWRAVDRAGQRLEETEPDWAEEVDSGSKRAEDFVPLRDRPLVLRAFNRIFGGVLLTCTRCGRRYTSDEMGDLILRGSPTFYICSCEWSFAPPPKELGCRADGSCWTVAIVDYEGTTPVRVMVLRRPDTGETLWYEPAEKLWEDFDPVGTELADGRGDA